MGHISRIRAIKWSRKWGWQMFNVNLACGALSVVVSTVPYKFRGQHAIGTIFFLANIVVYILNLAMTCRRIVRWPKVFYNSFYDQNEAVWFPVTIVAMATILIGVLLYGVPYTGPWLIVVCEVWFWIFVFLAAMTGLIMQSTFRTIPRRLKDISPPDALEVYPLMFIGVVGSTLASELVTVDSSRALTVTVFAYCFAGLGFFIGLLKLSVWVHHDMVYATAHPDTIPTYLISVGVPGFTSLTLTNLANTIGKIAEDNDFMSGLPVKANAEEVASMLAVASVLLSFLLLGMASWMLLIFLGWVVQAFLSDPTKSLWERWAFTWWGWTFPLTGVVLSFGRLATFLPSKAFGVLNIIFVLGMTLVFCVNAVGSVRMIWLGDLPGSYEEYDGERIERQRELD